MTTPPTDLRRNTTERGPVGTELMGVSVALPLKEVADWDREDWADAVRQYQPQMLEMLKRHVGGAQPAAMPQLSVDGPFSDPLQGTLYVMTCAAWVNPLSLPVDCPAYVARSQEARHG